MVSISNLIKCMVIFTIFLCCQIQATPINNDNNEMSDVDFGDSLDDLFPYYQEQFDHPQFRRASLRYHPNVFYKKASLKPIIGQNGKFTFNT